MRFPLTDLDLTVWVAITAITLLVTSDLLLPYANARTGVFVDKARLRFAAFILALVLIAIIAYKIYTILTM